MSNDVAMLDSLQTSGQLQQSVDIRWFEGIMALMQFQHPNVKIISQLQE